MKSNADSSHDTKISGQVTFLGRFDFIGTELMKFQKGRCINQVDVRAGIRIKYYVLYVLMRACSWQSDDTLHWGTSTAFHLRQKSHYFVAQRIEHTSV